MLNIKFIRENVEKVKKGTAAKQIDAGLVDKVLELDDKRRRLIGEIEELRKKRNEIAKRVKGADEEGKRIREELKVKEPELVKTVEEYTEVLYQIPNLPADDVKEGKGEEENEIIRSWGEPAKFSFDPKDHLEIGESLGIIDIERASKVSGTRFGYIKGDLVLLELAIVQYAFEYLVKESFVPVIPPVLIRKDVMRGMGYLEHGGEDDMYVLEKDDLILVGTSEQAIGPMHMNEVLDVKDLPRRYVGFSTCFRREAGSYGKDTRGIFRVHQFNKVEMFSFTKPEESNKEHEYLLGLEEKLLQSLNIPYQVSKMCSGDLGAPAARKYDLNAWLPGQNQYRELTSASTTTDFQARRLGIKYREGENTGYVHMLNGTAFADRPLIAILENYQQEDGSVVVPEVLRKWVGKDKITK